MFPHLWKSLMDEEFDRLMEKGTFKPADLPDGHKAIGLKWVFAFKEDAKGNVVHQKARLVVQGFHQERGVHYFESFAAIF